MHKRRQLDKHNYINSATDIDKHNEQCTVVHKKRKKNLKKTKTKIK